LGTVNNGTGIGFDDFYKNQESRAGTYTFRNNAWSAQYR
jgi:hypothetical protein